MERKNWMLLEPGELQGKDDLDAAFGGRSKQNEKSTADLWFSQKNGAAPRKAAPSAQADEPSPEPGGPKIKLADNLNLRLDSSARSGLLGPGSAQSESGLNQGIFTDSLRNSFGAAEATSTGARGDFGMRPMNSMSPGGLGGRGESISFGFGASQRPAPAAAFGGQSISRPAGLSPDPSLSQQPSSFGSALGNDSTLTRSRVGGLEKPSGGLSMPSASPAESLDSRSDRSTFEVPSRPR